MRRIQRDNQIPIENSRGRRSTTRGARATRSDDRWYLCVSGFVDENFASRANYFLFWHFSLASLPASFTLNRNNNASLTWSRPQKFRSFPFPKLGAFSTPIGGRKGNFYSLLSTLWCRKWTTKRVASFQLNVSPGKTQAKTAMNARRTTSFF